MRAKYKNFSGTTAIRVPKELSNAILHLIEVLDDYEESESSLEILMEITQKLQWTSIY
jgi:hypothetical protein